MKIKTIDINAFEWFDKQNGNSYFACEITLNYGQKNAKEITIPFNYGYGNHYETVSYNKLIELGYIKDDKKEFSLYRYCDSNKIILRRSKVENCKLKELQAIK